MRKIDLTDDEIMVLDGVCRPDTQELVEEARARIRMADAHPEIEAPLAHLVADACSYAAKNGALVFTRHSLRSCPLCGREAGYVLFKSGPRKGRPKRPKYFSGFDLYDASIVVKGHVRIGGCTECLERVRPLLVGELSRVRAQIPETITGHKPRYVKRRNRTCTKCGWAGHEGEMRQILKLLGNGRFPGGCPECDAENGIGNLFAIELAPGFVVVEAE